jgi:uncharacterized protein (TIGR03435 family)
MPDTQDMELVREFARDNSEAAFTKLVRRHINLVYSVARRCTGSDGDAHDVTQAVFIILARKAAGLREKTLLTGWLYETTRFAAARLLRTNARRHAREQEAYMQSTLNEADNSAVWEKLSPHLEAAMSKLAERDRALLVLRFYENKSGPEAAALLGIREDAAHKRVTRALEKLRKVFAQRGVTLSGAAIAGAVSANSVQAAPVALVKTISAVALVKGTIATASTLTLVKGALNLMAWTKIKTATGIGAVILAASITAVALDDSFFNPNSPKLFAAPTNVLILRQTHFTNQSDAAMESRSASNGKDDIRRAGQNQSIEQVLEMTYGISQTRMILPTNLPQGKFDYLITLPDHQQEGLQSEIKKEFGLIAHRESRETDVLLLKVKNSTATGLKPHPSGKSMGITAKDGKVYVMGQTIDVFANYFEYALKRPVVNQTSLDGRYDSILDEHLFDGTSDPKLVEKAGLDQLCLELVPSREPIEMLVVEKVK